MQTLYADLFRVALFVAFSGIAPAIWAKRRYGSPDRMPLSFFRLQRELPQSLVPAGCSLCKQ